MLTKAISYCIETHVSVDLMSAKPKSII